MGIDVLTNRYNNERTGANLNETVLNQSNVNVNGWSEGGKVVQAGPGGGRYSQEIHRGSGPRVLVCKQLLPYRFLITHDPQPI